MSHHTAGLEGESKGFGDRETDVILSGGGALADFVPGRSFDHSVVGDASAVILDVGSIVGNTEAACAAMHRFLSSDDFRL